MKLDEWHLEINEQRLPHQIKLQSHQIEKTFSQNDVPTQVMGGDITRQTIRFDLAGQFEAGKDLLFGIKKELLSMFGVSSIHFSRGFRGLQLHIDRHDEDRVTLIRLIRKLDEINSGTAILGIDDEGHPLLHEFTTSELSHILIQGGQEAGKSSLLRTIGVSLAMTNKQSQLQLLAISPNKAHENILKPLEYLPHMLEPLIETTDECKAILKFLQEEMQYRNHQRSTTPTIVVLMDDIDHYLADPQIENQLINILQNGSSAGIHLVIAQGELAQSALPEMMKANVPFQLIGRVSSREHAQRLTQMIDSDAELLNGKGEFLVISGESGYCFQAASINNYELHLVVDKLHRSRPRPLLAQPFEEHFEEQDELDSLVDQPEEPLPFSVKEGYQVKVGTNTSFSKFIAPAPAKEGADDDEEIPFDIGLPPD